MLSKEQFLNSVQQEIDVCKHLFGKLGQEQFSFQATDDMRTIDALLRYLTYCIAGPAEALISGDWSTLKPRIETASALALATFPAALDRQFEELEALLADLSDQDLGTRSARLPWGEEQPLGLALLNTSLKFATAYRMQLFLHAKQSGSADLKTINCWLGRDAMEGVPA